MNIKLNDIFKLNNDEISKSKLETNLNTRETGITFLDLWLKCSKDQKKAGKNDFSYWGWYGKQRNYKPNQWSFSFVRIDDDEWLFVSAAEIVDVPENSRAKIEVLKNFKPFFGRIILKWKKKNTFSRYVFNLDTFLDDLVVKQILPDLYNGEDFNGYDNVFLSYSRLNDVLNEKIMPTYCEALKKITGIYCLTNTDNGKLYIGSASGQGGILQRWKNYLDTSHGGNKKLIRLYDKEGEHYFVKHFTFTLLEYFGLNYDPDKIKDRERYWKKCLDTVENGYNDNY